MNNPGKVGFVSLGCAKATVDSERILTELRSQGYEMSARYDESDLVIVNTCGFIDAAIEESLDAIGEALNENGKVIVTGCLGAKGDVVKENFPNVLAVTGPHATEEVMEVVHHHLPPAHDPFLDLVPPGGMKLTPRHYAYLKISEGCNHRCTFCIIPQMRGDLVSRPAADVMGEAEALVSAGVKELLIVSQDTSAYGVDLKYATSFHGTAPVRAHIQDLAEALGRLGVWVRMHYIYPYPHVDNLLPLMADGLLLPYLDIPFQHASRTILKAMKRPAHSEKVLNRINEWRTVCPDLTVRSTFIVGFPGETDQDFAELLDFLDQAQIDRAGCFKYSDVDGATANAIGDQVPEAVKQERYEQFMQHQSEISAIRLTQKIGREMEVIIDSIDDDIAIGRTKGDAPEVDGVVEISDCDKAVIPGDIISVTITDATEYDLVASQ
jgi:ribosomal protein S12 methylthiotransferase